MWLLLKLLKRGIVFGICYRREQAIRLVYASHATPVLIQSFTSPFNTGLLDPAISPRNPKLLIQLFSLERDLQIQQLASTSSASLLSIVSLNRPSDLATLY